MKSCLQEQVYFSWATAKSSRISFPPLFLLPIPQVSITPPKRRRGLTTPSSPALPKKPLCLPLPQLSPSLSGFLLYCLFLPPPPLSRMHRREGRQPRQTRAKTAAKKQLHSLRESSIPVWKDPLPKSQQPHPKLFSFSTGGGGGWEKRGEGMEGENLGRAQKDFLTLFSRSTRRQDFALGPTPPRV